MFHSQKSFEKSLRSSTAASTSYQVPIITPLKTEIHKGCTGKAHACGTIKSTNTILVNKTALSSTPSSVAVKVKAKCENKAMRKNSLSSETVSDSGSESWNSNGKDTSGSSSTNNVPVTLPKSPLKRTKSVNYGSSTTGTNGNVRRRTSDSVINTDVTDNSSVKAQPNGKTLQRGRLSSDGDGKQTPADADVSRLRRSASFRSKNIPPLIPLKPKPVASSSAAIIKQNGNFNNSGRLRSSFRGLKNQTVNWNAIYEASFTSKLGGGSFRNFDKTLLEVINFSKSINGWIHFFIDRLTFNFFRI